MGGHVLKPKIMYPSIKGVNKGLLKRSDAFLKAKYPYLKLYKFK